MAIVMSSKKFAAGALLMYTLGGVTLGVKGLKMNFSSQDVKEEDKTIRPDLAEALNDLDEPALDLWGLVEGKDSSELIFEYSKSGLKDSAHGRNDKTGKTFFYYDVVMITERGAIPAKFQGDSVKNIDHLVNRLKLAWIEQGTRYTYRAELVMRKRVKSEIDAIIAAWKVVSKTSYLVRRAYSCMRKFSQWADGDKANASRPNSK